MKRYQELLIKLVLLTAIVSTTGCASWFIDTKQGSDKVMLKESSEITQCQLIGTSTVSVLSKVGFVSRGVDNIELNLIQLAKNSAVDMGGDTVVKKETSKLGERPFDVYKCN